MYKVSLEGILHGIGRLQFGRMRMQKGSFIVLVFYFYKGLPVVGFSQKKIFAFFESYVWVVCIEIQLETECINVDKFGGFYGRWLLID